MDFRTAKIWNEDWFNNSSDQKVISEINDLFKNEQVKEIFNFDVILKKTISELNRRKIKPKEEKNVNAEDISFIIKEYQKKISNSAKALPEAKNKIRIRLRTFSKEELLEAVDKFSKDEWWMEHNSERGIAWFFSGNIRIEQFLNLKTKRQLI